MEHARRVLTRDQLLDISRGMSAGQFDRAIDVQVSRLRRKLLRENDESELMRTARNEGYMFTADVGRPRRASRDDRPIVVAIVALVVGAVLASTAVLFAVTYGGRHQCRCPRGSTRSPSG